jgi:spermidine/putrescine transport system permease protein
MAVESPSSLPAVRPASWIYSAWLGGIALLGPAGLWLLLLLVVPTVLILLISLSPGFRPGDLVTIGGLANYAQAFEPLYGTVVLRSIGLAVATTVISLVLGFPVAYWIAIKAADRWRNILLLGFVLPLFTSSLLRSYAWLTILRPTGVLNTILTALHLPTVQLLREPPAVLIGMVHGMLPYVVLILYSSLEKLDRRLLEAAADLGASPRVTFWRVTIPQTLTGLCASGLLVFITSLGDFTNPELLGGATNMTLARLIYGQFLGGSRNWGFGSALSMLLIGLVSLAIALLIRYGEAKPDAR